MNGIWAYIPLTKIQADPPSRKKDTSLVTNITIPPNVGDDDDDDDKPQQRLIMIFYGAYRISRRSIKFSSR